MSWHEDSSFDSAIGCRDNSQSISVILTSRACMPSWVMARRMSLSICLLPWVMARLCAWDWSLVRSGSPSLAMDWLGYLSSAMDWLELSLGHGWVRVSLSGHGLGRHRLSQGLDWGGTISLGGGTIPTWDRRISPFVRCALFNPRISPHALSLRAGCRSLHVTRSIFLSKHSYPISPQVTCN